ncbi:6-phospho 3-hexuloisomerase [Flavobacterium rivuli WB 3.3-2 = DSM 21788]|uniref:6-phospho 3-hexuloisomerase n=1 Tax=Flavobacterium rivuli WB 3.3-2 = DSM 21788 TaxID=1121895 RepID=A0A0A2M5R0_9FLAO|nr:6-phospho-3-hexuloisomerase [Flavobacterium rivuli]KGO87599.1 6-phospho 3-hexuloisomerase [Flavobacterium rivuli WB 3.3-2 = DSM 21788]
MQTQNEVHKQELVDNLKMSLDLILNENLQLSQKIDLETLVPFINYIRQSPRIFILSAGRSGFAMRSFAMRLMHLGLTVYFVGETTTPAIQQGDLLIAASGSGTTAGIVRAAEKATSTGASLVALTTNTASPLAKLANHVVYIPAAEKEDHGGDKSKQYAGSLFEQFLLLLMDAVFQSLWKLDGTPAEELWKRHANLE